MTTTSRPMRGRLPIAIVAVAAVLFVTSVTLAYAFADPVSAPPRDSDLPVITTTVVRDAPPATEVTITPQLPAIADDDDDEDDEHETVRPRVRVEDPEDDGDDDGGRSDDHDEADDDSDDDHNSDDHDEDDDSDDHADGGESADDEEADTHD